MAGHALAAFCGLCALVWMLSCCAGRGAAAEDGLDARLGFDGIVKLGVPLPLDVTLPPLPQEGRAELIVDAPALGPEVGPVVTSTSVPFRAVAGTARAFHIPVVITDPRRPLTLRVRINDREVLRRIVRISPSQIGDLVVLVLSDARFGMAPLRRLPGHVAVAYVTAQSLPRRWQEYAGADLLVLRDLDPAAIDDAQRQALLTWVRLGGRLLVIPGPTSPVPAFLDPVLPASVGTIGSVASLAALAARYGAALPPGPYSVAALAPRAGARQFSSAGVPVIVSGAAGDGQVTVWAFDPWRPPFLEWDGRLRLWGAVLGGGSRPRIDPDAMAAWVAGETSLNPAVHAGAGAAIFLYVVGLLGFLRRRPTTRGAAESLVLVLIGIGGFAALAGIARDRSTALTQVTLLEVVPGTGLGRATTVASVSVPHGGPFRVSVADEAIATPVTPAGDLVISLTRAGTVLSGVLRPGEAGRALQALGASTVAASGWVAADGRSLSIELRSARARRVILRWRGRAYPLGDLPPGRTDRALDPGRWAAAADERGSPELADRVRTGIFQPPLGDAILKDATPLLVGELDGSPPVFALGGAGAQGARLTILLVPLERR